MRRARGAVVTGNTAAQDAVLLDGIPASTARHNGGRLKVGPDGMLYETTGDANNTAFSQNAASLAGSDGAVYVTTSNGGGADRLLRIGR